MEGRPAVSVIDKDSPKLRPSTGANHSEHFGEVVEGILLGAGDGKCDFSPRKLLSQGKGTAEIWRGATR